MAVAPQDVEAAEEGFRWRRWWQVSLPVTEAYKLDVNMLLFRMVDPHLRSHYNKKVRLVNFVY